MRANQPEFVTYAHAAIRDEQWIRYWWWMNAYFFFYFWHITIKGSISYVRSLFRG